MRMTVLASGSKGNSTVISSGRTRVLVDAGLSCRELLRRMAIAEEDPAQLDAILITHEHQDHVAGLAVLARRLKIPVFFTEPTHRAWVRMLTPRTTMTYAKWLDHLQKEKQARAAATAAAIPTYELTEPSSAPDPAQLEAVAHISAEAASLDPALNRSDDPNAMMELPGDEDQESCDQQASADLPAKEKADPTFLPAVEYFRAGTNFSIGDIEISPFTIPHDAADPCGFVFEADGIRMALATDLGYMPPNVKAALKRIDVLLLESNHDLEMLRDGPYPWSVKQRVLSRVGHLSNDATAEFLARDYDGGAAYIVLGHLSESNNNPALALLAAEQAIGDRMTLLGNRVLLAHQAEPLASICL
ncbi:MBL fold metallo-hydrolase [Granulicella sibirica]|uniref:Metal-dependent hydrolases of the beta-lactamase superfamily I n=1 Tax=Granulicella sibirica TaxID=2479048 RepID=A0A4Q0T7A4_9BACT|nr:MBL fold metallo-hydrolase [Granulicella sibirica]RXH57556.1 Metal-dependent hydrolases of the beta-lactamase superfamily I [Granulicella sibirica]